MNERLISMKEVTSRVPFTKVHVYRLIKRGEFPDRVKIGKRRVCWRESDIDAWIASKVAAATSKERRDERGSFRGAAESARQEADTSFALDRQTSLRQSLLGTWSSGWKPYRLREKDKRPPGKREANILTPENIDRLLNPAVHNLGVLLGKESDGLVDLDLDWPEARVVGSAMFRTLLASGVPAHAARINSSGVPAPLSC